MDYQEIQKPVETLLRKSNGILHQNLDNPIELIQSLHRSTPVSEGKKIRSTFFFLLAGINGIRSPILPEIGAAVEMFHLSSLIHDDVIDHSLMRRGKKSAQAAFGNTISVLWGDYLYITSLKLLQSLHPLRIDDIFIQTSHIMIEGQIEEIENHFNYAMEEEKYLKIIQKKTASLFEAIGRIVARLQDTPDNRRTLWQFCSEFGMIFQICDDSLDVFSSNSGKDRFRDLQEGKITLPYIMFLRNDSKKLLEDPSRSGRGKLLKKMREQGIPERINSYISRHIDAGRSFLDSFPPSVFKESMNQLIDFISTRDY